MDPPRVLQLYCIDSIWGCAAASCLQAAGNLARFEDEYGFTRVDYVVDQPDGDYELVVASSCRGPGATGVDECVAVDPLQRRCRPFASSLYY